MKTSGQSELKTLIKRISERLSEVEESIRLLDRERLALVIIKRETYVKLRNLVYGDTPIDPSPPLRDKDLAVQATITGVEDEEEEEEKEIEFEY